MFELIGYWGVVSIASFIAIAPFTFIFYLVALSFMENVLGDKYKAQRAVDKLINCKTKKGFTILEQKVIHEALYVGSIVIGAIANILIAVHSGVHDMHYSDSLILFVSRAGEVLSPVATYIIIPAALYYGAVYLTKKFIKVKAKLDTISTKLKEVG